MNIVDNIDNNNIDNNNIDNNNIDNIDNNNVDNDNDDNDNLVKGGNKQKFLGEGSYGCTWNPGLDCYGKKKF